MTIDDLVGSPKAYENRKKEKETKSLGESLTNKDDNQGEQGDVCATQPRKRIGCKGCSYGRNGGHGCGNNNEKREQMNQQNWLGWCYDHERGGRSNRPNVECHNCGK